jgi:hypothetical protein
MYKILGSTINNESKKYVVSKGGNEEDQSPMISGEKAMKWHQILGHIGKKCLQALHDKCMVKGMPNCTLDFDLCEHYIYGKHNLVIFSFGATREKRILELVHNDVFVIVLVPSLGKYVYYVVFNDDFSRNT